MLASSEKSIRKPGELIIGISTSENVKNVINPFACAKAIGVKAVNFTCEMGGEMLNLADCTVNVSANKTP